MPSVGCSKRLSAFAEFFQQVFDGDDSGVSDCWLDARDVTENSVFVALQGTRFHGVQFMTQAIERGAKLILLDPTGLSEQAIAEAQALAGDVTCWSIPTLASQIAHFANWFYDTPSQALQVIGITGTNGKTSTAHFTAQLLASQGEKVALMGTLGNGILGDLRPSPNTTLEPIALQRTLRAYVDAGVQSVVMEVSSHAIALHRIAGVHFAVVALTQVTRDHLDFHGSLQDYRQVKAKLFTDIAAQHRVLNLEDSLGQTLSQSVTAFHYSTQQTGELHTRAVQFGAQGIAGLVIFKEQTAELRTRLMGQFNLENLLCALSIGLTLSYDFKRLVVAANELAAVEGRMQQVHQQPTVIVDYAHTPDALEAVLTALKAHVQQGKLWVVFGCGGDRDEGKRPLMGAIAERLADQVVLTNDNPRYEAPERIMQMIQAGLTQSAEVIYDRQVAIETVLATATQDDLVLIAGKGHETTQEIQGACDPFSDVEVVKAWFKEQTT